MSSSSCADTLANHLSHTGCEDYEIGILVQVVERVRTFGEFELRKINRLDRNGLLPIDALELAERIRQARLSREARGSLDARSIHHRDEDAAGKGRGDRQVIVRLEAMRRTIGFLGPRSEERRVGREGVE